MKRRLIIFFLSAYAAWISACDTPSNTPFPGEKFFVKHYGGDGNHFGVDLLEIGNGELLLLGNSEFGEARRIYLVKVDALGNVRGEWLLDGTADVAVDLAATPDGNFVILSREETDPADTEIKLTRITSEGTVLQTITIGFPGAMDYPESVTPLADGGVIVTGRTLFGEADPASTDPNAFAEQMHFKVFPDGGVDTFFRERYGIVGADDAAVRTFVTGQFAYVFGHSSRAHHGRGQGPRNLQYYGIDLFSGSIVGEPGYLGDFNKDSYSADACKVPASLGGGYAFMGTSRTGAVSSLHVVKLPEVLMFNASDRNLDLLVSIPGSNDVEAVSIAASEHGTPGFLLLGNENRDLITRNILVSKIDLSGVLKWSVSLGSEGEDDWGSAILELASGKILVLGSVEVGNNQSKMTLFKLNDKGRLQD